MIVQYRMELFVEVDVVEENDDCKAEGWYF
jgi:hypothetical protein